MSARVAVVAVDIALGVVLALLLAFVLSAAEQPIPFVYQGF